MRRTKKRACRAEPIQQGSDWEEPRLEAGRFSGHAQPVCRRDARRTRQNQQVAVTAPSMALVTLRARHDSQAVLFRAGAPIAGTPNDFIAAHLSLLPECADRADPHFDAVRPVNHAYVIAKGHLQENGFPRHRRVSVATER
jgi:hypothetical protein